MAKEIITATGRRKRSNAQVRMTAGKGTITVNGKDVNDYMPFATLVMDLKQPLDVTGNTEKYDIDVTVKGGGFSGQAGAIRLAITRALIIADSNSDVNREDAYKKVLKVNGFVTRDPRVKERKKPGLRKARRAPQFSKR